jgi:serine protease inhibitor
MHRDRHGLVTTVAAAALLVAGVVDAAAADAAAADAAAADAAAADAAVDVAGADNAFGFRLLNAVQKSVPKGNVILSSVSAALDLSMVLNGAVDETRQEMLTALSLDGLDLNAVNSANAALIKVIRTPANNITLSVADSLWVDNRRATLRPDYLKQTRAWYDAAVTDLDFSNPSAVTQINSWASKETHGKIAKVIERIDPADLVLLLNAVYFKGQWTHKFDPAQTQPRDFALVDGTVKQTPRMAQEGRFAYFATADMQAIRLPFGDGELVLQVLLPAKSSSLAALESQLTPEHWKAWQKLYMQRPGRIELPRFELKSNYRLNPALQALGMMRAFRAGGRDGAQLTDMLSPAPGRAAAHSFFISSVQQSVYWKVDEQGSEAAAVTSTMIRSAALARPPQPFNMIVDRPFFCAIEDQRTGALLFVGAIYDPGA